MEHLQDVLGEYHDSVVTQVRLHELALAGTPAAAFALGRLHAQQAEQQAAAERRRRAGRSRRREEVAARLAHLSGVDALERGPLAPPARTLVDILGATAAAFPDAPAIDDGHVVLTYAELLTRSQEVARRLDAAGVGRGDRVGIRMPSGHGRPLRRDPRHARRRRRLRAGRRRRPAGAGQPGLPQAGVSAVLTGDLDLRRTGRSRPTRPVSRRVVAPTRGRRRLDHLHVRLDRRRRRASRSPTVRPPRSSTPRRGSSCRSSRSARATGCSPGCRSPSTRRARRCGWPGGTAPAWCRRRARWSAAAWTSAPWLVDQRDHGRLDRARRWPRCGRPTSLDRGAAADLRRRGLPARAGRPAGRRRPRGLEHLRPDRGDRRRLRRPADAGGAGADRPAARRLGPRRRRPRGPAGRRGRGRRADHRRRRPGPLPGHPPRTPRSSRRCRPSAGSGPTAAATWCAPTPRACSSSAGPTTRSRSAAGGSSSARSTPRCSALPGVGGAAAAVRTHGGRQPGPGRLPRDAGRARARPAAAAIAALRDVAARAARAAAGRRRRPPDPHLGQGRPRRAALAAGAGPVRGRRHPRPTCTGTAALAGRAWAEVLGTAAGGRDADFFAHGGGSLAAAQLVSALRARFPQVTVADVYEHPQLGAAGRPARRARPGRRVDRSDAHGAARAARGPSSCSSSSPLPAGLRDRRSLAGLGRGHGQRAARDRRPVPWLPPTSRGGGSLVGWLLLISPPGRMA